MTLDYRPNDAMMLYATWSRGYRSGGFSGRGQTVISATTPYDPETVSVYEVGAKTEWFDRRLALNVAGYYTDYKNIQQNTTVTLPPRRMHSDRISPLAASTVRTCSGSRSSKSSTG